MFSIRKNDFVQTGIVIYEYKDSPFSVFLNISHNGTKIIIKPRFKNSNYAVKAYTLSLPLNNNFNGFDFQIYEKSTNTNNISAEIRNEISFYLSKLPEILTPWIEICSLLQSLQDKSLEISAKIAIEAWEKEHPNSPSYPMDIAKDEIAANILDDLSAYPEMKTFVALFLATNKNILA